MRYLYVEDSNNFGFKDDKINEILETDIEISEDVYNEFFEEQAKGKEFIIKNKHRKTFEEIFEEIKLEPMEEIQVEPSPVEKLQEENAKMKKEMDNMKENIRQSIAELTMMIIPQ